MDSILQYHKTEINCFSLIPEQSKGYDMSLILKENELVSCDCSGDIVFWKKEEVECAFFSFFAGSVEVIPSSIGWRANR